MGVISSSLELLFYCHHSPQYNNKKMIVALSTLSLWHCNQFYCWRLAPLQSLMWLTCINQKGWLLLVQSCALPRRDQPSALLPAIQQKKILSSLLLLAIRRRMLMIDHCIKEVHHKRFVPAFAIIVCSIAI